MKKKWISVLLAVILLTLVVDVMPSGSLVALAETPPVPNAVSPNSLSAPRCIDMPDAQMWGREPGTGCRVRIVPLLNRHDGKQGGILPLGTGLYRRGWTNKWTSESDSDLLEDRIKVEGYLYWANNGLLLDNCADDNSWASHAACRTYGGTSGSHLRQDGYHYFHTAGFYDDSFQSSDNWTV